MSRSRHGRSTQLQQLYHCLQPPPPWHGRLHYFRPIWHDKAKGNSTVIRVQNWILAFQKMIDQISKAPTGGGIGLGESSLGFRRALAPAISTLLSPLHLALRQPDPSRHSALSCSNFLACTPPKWRNRCRTKLQLRRCLFYQYHSVG